VGGAPPDRAEAGEPGSAVTVATLPRLLVVDDHAVFTQALGLALESHGVATVEPAEELAADAVRARAEERRPDVVLVDLDLGGGASGVPLVRDLAARGVAVLVVTALDDDARLGECLEAGAVGVFHKTRPLEELAELVQRAVGGEAVTSPARREELLAALRQARARRQADTGPFASLTEREAAVLGSLMDGKAAREIAADHFVSEATVRTHIRSVLQKLGVHSQLAAVARARAAGWRPE
jgi:two-component system nitrate/nitrite response regulator NarL